MPRRRILQPIVRRNNDVGLARRVAVNAAAAAVGHIGGQMLRNGADAVVRRVVNKASRPQPKKRKPAAGSSSAVAKGPAQWERMSFRGGRRVSYAVKNKRILAAGINRYVTSFKGLSGSPDGGWSGDAGYYWLSMLKSTDGLSTQFPVYIQNLTAVPNDGQFPSPFMRLQGTVQNVTSSINFNWAAKQGQNNSGGNSTALTIMESPGTSTTTTQVGAKAYLDWISVKANIYGATARPSEVRVSLVYFTDDDMLPENNLPGGMAHNKHNLFWSAIVKRLIGNPIADSNAPAAGAMRTIWSTTVRIQPGQTTDQDQDPDTRTLNIFRRINRVLNYRGDAGPTASLGQISDPGASVQHSNSDAYGMYPAKPRDNIYLLVTAVNHSPQTASSDALTSATTTSSFDLNTRCGFKILDSF